MKTIRETAKENATELISENIDRYNELAHLSHNHIWLEAYPDGNVTEAEEPDNNTTHWIDYPTKEVASILTIAKCEYCDCDACASWRQSSDDDITDEEFESRWGFSKEDVGNDFARHLRDYDAYDGDIEYNALVAIDEIEYGYFDDEQ